MNVLLTGNKGYIGPVMTCMLKDKGHTVKGVDCGYFEEYGFFPDECEPHHQLIKDVRHLDEADLEGIDAVIHLAGLSNDPLGDLVPELTESINLNASKRLADLAKGKGVQKFVFASSCSLYGIAPSDRAMKEDDDLNPITAYAKSKVYFEEYLKEIADDNFHPVFLRNATVYGNSPRLRLDLVANNLSAHAYLFGEIRILSDGKPWRPLLHIEDFCRAFVAALEAPADVIHCEAFNVGRNSENFTVADIASMVGQVIPSATVSILNETGGDDRSYKVNFDKINAALPQFNPQWTLEKGIEDLVAAYRKHDLTVGDWESGRYFRLKVLDKLMKSKKVDSNLYMRS